MRHYFTNEEVRHHFMRHDVFLKEKRYSFYTDNGVFSKKGMDFGTRSLLENLPFYEMQGDILDFGCGYGPIGIITSKNTNAKVDMLDVNQRSIDLAKKNALLNEAKVSIFESNLYEKVEKKYDYILSNPPIRVGKKILYQILFGAKEHLKENGEVWFVIHKDQGAQSVLRDLEKEYVTKLICKNKGFYIIMLKIR